jgi:hypothetical protein
MKSMKPWSANLIDASSWMAVTAIMRKLLVMASSLLRDRRKCVDILP